MNKLDLIDVANSFKTFDEMYNLIISGDCSFLLRKLGTNEYPEIRWMIEYFTEKEEYEKCHFLSKIRITKNKFIDYGT